MRNNILGGLVIFFVVVTCLLMLDDISNNKNVQSTFEKSTVEEQVENQSTDLAVIEEQE